MRLNQFLARAGLGSRRACEELILSGDVTINGHRINQLATQVSTNDRVLVKGKPIDQPATLVAALHKPAGYLCASAESTEEKTIYDLLPKGWPRVVYVGRLDKDSEGLLIVTNDGKLAQRLTHPSHKLPKIYIVTLNEEFDFSLAPKLLKGMVLEEGHARVDDVYRVGPYTLKVTLTQGLKRQIRNMFYRLGYEVRRLVRIQIGGLTLGDLPVGAVRVLKQREIQEVFPNTPKKQAIQIRPTRPASTTVKQEADAAVGSDTRRESLRKPVGSRRPMRPSRRPSRG